MFRIIGRRFGSKGRAFGLVLLGFGEPFLERICFGEFIPALRYAPPGVPTLGSAGILIAPTLIALLVMRFAGGPSGEPK